MRAIVTKPFPGLPDGETQVKNFVVGDVVTGDLARVALENRWAKAEGAVAEKDEAQDQGEGAKTGLFGKGGKGKKGKPEPEPEPEEVDGETVEDEAQDQGEGE